MGSEVSLPLIKSILKKATESDGNPKPKGTLPEWVPDPAAQAELLAWLVAAELAADVTAAALDETAVEVATLELLATGVLDEVTATELDALLTAELTRLEEASVEA